MSQIISAAIVGAHRCIARALGMSSLGLIIGTAGCSSDSTSLQDEGLEEEENALTPASDFIIPFSEGSPASAYFDDSQQTLYVADNENNQIWSWSDAAGLARYATTLDPGGQLEAGAAGVGQIIALPDGTLVVARTGLPAGGFSAIAWVLPDGSTGLVPGLDEDKKRLGLTQASDGTIYGTHFGPAPSGMGQAGAVTRVDLETGETVLSEGFGKLVGIVAMDETVFVSDQSAGVIYSAPLSALPAQAADWAVFAEVAVPDQICAGPDGSLFSGQFRPAPNSTETVAIRQIHADGSVTRFVADPFVAKPSGVAYDSAQRRLFAADAGNSAQLGIHVFPVP